MIFSKGEFTSFYHCRFAPSRKTGRYVAYHMSMLYYMIYTIGAFIQLGLAVCSHGELLFKNSIVIWNRAWRRYSTLSQFLSQQHLSDTCPSKVSEPSKHQ